MVGMTTAYRSELSKNADEARAERIARLRAERGTAAAAERTARLEAEKAAEAARRAAARREADERFVESLALRVPPARLEKALAEIERSIEGTLADFPDVSDDDVAHDTIVAYVRNLVPNAANLGLAAEILRCKLAYSARETLSLLGVPTR